MPRCSTTSVSRASVKIARLADRPEALPTVAGWFSSEWPDHPVDLSQGCVLVACEAGEPLGTVSLRAHALDGHPQLAPGLGGLYVAPAHRRRGVASALVRAAMTMGNVELYAATAHARGVFERLGWHLFQTVTHEGEALAVYRWRA